MFMWVMKTDLRSWLNMTQHFLCPHTINCAQIFLYQHPNYSTSSNIQTGITFTLGDRQIEWYTLNNICGAPYIDISHSWHQFNDEAVAVCEPQIMLLCIPLSVCSSDAICLTTSACGDMSHLHLLHNVKHNGIQAVCSYEKVRTKK